MDTPTRERIEAIESRLMLIESAIVSLQAQRDTPTAPPQGFREIKDSITVKPERPALSPVGDIPKPFTDGPGLSSLPMAAGAIPLPKDQDQ